MDVLTTLRKIRIIFAIVGLILVVLSLINTVQELFGANGFLGKADPLVSNLAFVLIGASLVMIPFLQNKDPQRKDGH